MSEKYYTVQDKINGAFSTVNESDYKPYDPASGGSSFDPSVLEPYAKITDVDASLNLKADKTSISTMVRSNKEGIKIWTGTQDEYDAIRTKDDNTVYFVKGVGIEIE